VFSEPDSILLPTEIIVDEALKRLTNMQTMKKGEQVLENVKDSVALHWLSKGLRVMGPNMKKHGV
jgi:hypothetical protein